ncbi:beta-N-acetylhexosaminidase [Hymenobacter nivis]|uniref:beta-N-acetylhexosaminidase n=1 Tax=Hymenobacter nivis TaxID=1850093 RepID=UPI001375FEE4|nr:family 20 glycosylhydrolase [Hymenobacter nivis]
MLLAIMGAPSARGQVPGAPSPLLPQPTELHWGTGRLPLKSALHLQIAAPAVPDPAVRPAALRTLARLHRGAPARPAKTPGPVLQIRYGRAGQLAQPGEERYSLRVTPGGVLIDAPTGLGVLRALATLEQLPHAGPAGRYLPEADVADQPRFAWRGLLIDPARHFLPVAVVKRNIDGMAAVKLNVLHWHLCDDEGFRVESKLLPRLQQVAGATGYYTQAQVREVVAYAAARGIRVVPEFDLPGHTGALVAAYPRLASNDSIKEVPVRWGLLNIAIDPTKPGTYPFLDSLLTEMSGLFPDPYFHIGGDENDGRQWRHNPRIVAFMRDNKMLKAGTTDVDKHQLQTYFNRKMLALLTARGKTMVGWDEILGPDLPKEVVIQSWRGAKGLNEAVRLGHRALLSNGYYLDLNYPAAAHYAADPLPAATPLSAAQQQLVLGGEVAMWSEFADSVIYDSRVWPRAAAVAERLWSPQATTQNVPDLYRRLALVSTQLEALGLQHRRAPAQLLRQMAPAGTLGPLTTLADVLEPVKDYKRHFQGFKYTTQTPLTRLVDAAPAESDVARQFGATVDSVLAGLGAPVRPPALARQLLQLRAQLLRWQAADATLRPLLLASPALSEYAPLSTRLGALAAVLLERLTQLEANQPALPVWQMTARAILDEAQLPAGQAELAVVKAARRLAGL